MLDFEVVLAFARERYRGAGAETVSVRPLAGGLESENVAKVAVRSKDDRHLGTFVVKSLSGAALREYRVLRMIHASGCGSAAPRLLGFQPIARDQGYEFLEWVEPARRWPWANPETAALVLQQLARVHGCGAGRFADAVSGWDYDAELAASARSTIDLYRSAYVAGVRVSPRPMLPTLGRVAEALPRIRKQLAAYMGQALVHGDVHSGNAVLRRQDRTEVPVLLDWGRARLGSPLEDVCSWIHSLAFWEPEARRRHDTLLARYLQFRGSFSGLSRDFRDACWLAAGCNAFAGALRYHLSIAGDPSKPGRQRWNAACAAADWLRVVRRADVCWRR